MKKLNLFVLMKAFAVCCSKRGISEKPIEYGSEKVVIPLKKGIHVSLKRMKRTMGWIPAFAGMT